MPGDDWPSVGESVAAVRGKLCVEFGEVVWGERREREREGKEKEGDEVSPRKSSKEVKGEGGGGGGGEGLQEKFEGLVISDLEGEEQETKASDQNADVAIEETR